MTQQITPIRLPLPLNMSHVNAYLVRTDQGFYLVDSGMSNARHQIEQALEHLCCRPGDLKLVLLTHGDFDHIGNAAHLRAKFGAKIAMHQGDSGMLINGDMFWNRKIKNSLLKNLVSGLIRLSEKDRCEPDIYLEDGSSLAEYGWEAQVFNTPGHSTGSISILTAYGDLFCGDLLTNSTGKPMLNSMMYDHPAGQASLEKLKAYLIKTVYPGHGPSFAWEALAG